MTIEEIDQLARRFSDARNDLSTCVEALEQDINAVKKSHRDGVRRNIVKARAARESLIQAIEEAQPLFKKPKSRVLHGIKLGFRKKPGQLKWSSPAEVIKLIRKHFPHKSSVLIRVKEEPARAALNELKVSDLEKRGVQVTHSSDEVLCEPIADDVDRLIDAYFARDEIDEFRAGEPA